MNIGESEKSTDPKFLSRIRSNPCLVDKGEGCYSKECPQKDTDLSEIKSSLFINLLLSHTETMKHLYEFLDTISLEILKYLDIDPGVNLLYYKTQFLYLDEEVRRKARDYPVGNPVFPYYENDIKSNFFSYYNYVKWNWYKIYDLDYDCKCNPKTIYLYTVLEIFQQSTTSFHKILRGPRKNKDNNPKNNQIGITNIKLQELVNTEHSQEWEHSGKTRCLSPYFGKYGEFIKDNEGGVYGSLLCGISASTQFTFFMYLLSVIGNNTTHDLDYYNQEFTKLFLTSIIVLCGDGGHNFREIIVGIVITIIVMHHLIKYVLEEPRILIPVIDRIFSRNPKLSRCRDQDILDKIVDSCKTWKPYVDAFYKITGDINPVNTFKPDIQRYYPHILRYSREKRQEYIRSTIFDLVVNRDWDWKDDRRELFGKLDQVQICLALDNDRYLLDPQRSFKNIADRKINEMSKGLEVDSQIDAIYTRCKIRRKFNTIPFA